MNPIKRFSITLAFLLAAVAFYLIGFAPGFGAFFVLGACFETVFWIRLLNRRYKSNQRLRELRQANNSAQAPG